MSSQEVSYDSLLASYHSVPQLKYDSKDSPAGKGQGGKGSQAICYFGGIQGFKTQLVAVEEVSSRVLYSVRVHMLYGYMLHDCRV